MKVEVESEIGKHAVWSLSTAKQGSGVQQLRDNSIDTFWQSDGPQPHQINIQFHKIMSVKEISIYLDYKKDESYTPQRIVVRTGSSSYDLKDLKTVEWNEPTGWQSITFSNKDDEDEGENDENEKEPTDYKIIRTNMIQLLVEANHQNGRDTHIRQIKVFGPSSSNTTTFVYSHQLTKVEKQSSVQ